MIASVVAATALACLSPHHEVGPFVVHSGFGSTARLESSGVVGCTVRYVLKSTTPGRTLKYEMPRFLHDVRFGEKGRPIVVRLLDSRGRLVWATGNNGRGAQWVHLRRHVTVEPLPKPDVVTLLRSLSAAFALSVPDALTHALGQQPTPTPKLTATHGSVFPDRTYVLQLSPRAAMPKPFLTENGMPVSNLAISTPGGSASGTYVISYRSLLPPEVKAVVSATITGFPAATTIYTTPALNVTASEDFQWRWKDSQYVTVFALITLMAFALLTRFKRRG
jgi:hypothetical protein